MRAHTSPQPTHSPTHTQALKEAEEAARLEALDATAQLHAIQSSVVGQATELASSLREEQEAIKRATLQFQTAQASWAWW